jgi:hypothetical protein
MKLEGERDDEKPGLGKNCCKDKESTAILGM